MFDSRNRAKEEQLSDRPSIRPGDHAILIYKNQGEKYRVLAKYFAEGMEKGERCLYVARKSEQGKELNALAKNGLPARKKRLFTMLCAEDVYLHNGAFCPERVISLIKTFTKDASAKGIPALRCAGDMSWVLDKPYGAERLMGYEARLNFLMPSSNISAICLYPQKGFPAEFLKNALQTHPKLVLNGDGEENRKYIPPEKFLVSEQALLSQEYFMSPDNRGRQKNRKLANARKAFLESFAHAKLTARERKILEHALVFHSNEEISERLSIRINTVKQHLKNIFRKIRLKSRMEVLKLFYDQYY